MRPVLFYVGSFPIRSYGLMIAIGVILGGALAANIARRRGKYENEVLDFVLYAFIAGLVGSRLWEVAFTWDYYGKNLAEIPAIWHGGLSIQGGVVAGLLVAIWYCRSKKINFWEMVDILAPGVILGQAIGRVGCFLNGDAFGMPTDTIFGVTYKPGTMAYDFYGGPVPLWPAELFEAGWDLVVLGLLLLLHRAKNRGRVKLADGAFAFFYAILYSTGRFLLEFLRADSLRTVYGLKAAQVTSILIIIIAAAILALRLRSGPAAVPGEAATAAPATVGVGEIGCSGGEKESV